MEAVMNIIAAFMMIAVSIFAITMSVIVTIILVKDIKEGRI